MRLRVGISPCPNDTFAFHALLTRALHVDGLEFDFVLADVEELNERALRGELDLAKLSLHAALHAARDWRLLPSGAALGFGVGPLLLAPPAGSKAPKAGSRQRVLAPGARTTATLLWQLFHGGSGELQQRVFSEILPALARGEAEAGICIHEGRFVYAELGLQLVEDLGQRWERATGCALPLGGIALRRELDEATQRSCARAVRASIAWAHAHPQECLASMRAHAQEQSERVLWQHVELYVNEETTELSRAGRAAIERLGARARAAGLLPDSLPALEIWGAPATRERVFHLSSATHWQRLRSGAHARLEPDSLAREGFVHLSFEAQIEGTLRAHFAGARGLVRLELDALRLGDALRVEPSRGGQLFPHAYRALERADVLACEPIPDAR
jgi:1,4-dihydroxy-6-naphthoate synthase